MEKEYTTDMSSGMAIGAEGVFLAAASYSAKRAGDAVGDLLDEVVKEFKNKIPDNDSVTRHIFAEREGRHILDTKDNRTLLEEVANDMDNFRGTDQYGNEWYSKLLEDGKQVWVQVRDGKIFDGGVNELPKPWDLQTGLKQNIRRK